MADQTQGVKLASGIELACQVHGDPGNPVLMPVLGITDNITDWPEPLYAPLVDAGFQVVRHELRDSGHSTRFEDQGTPDLAAAARLQAEGRPVPAAYTIRDVAADVCGLMDALQIDSATLVGYSFGAAVAQLVALEEPQRVDALVCLQGTNYDHALPARTPAVNAAMLAASDRYETREQCVQAMHNLRLATNGTEYRMDEAEALRSAEQSVARAYHPDGTRRLVNSRFAIAPFHEQTGGISAPTLVLHGSDDPIFPLAHGEDLARRIPGAELRVLSGAGHNHPDSLKPVIVEELLAFLRRR